MDIDLRKYWLPLLADIERSLRKFRDANPGIELCTIALFGDGFHGSASLCVDTPGHSAQFVRQWAEHGGVLEDEAGQFCANVPDFEYWLGTFSFSGYPDLYQSDPNDRLTFISLDGTAAIVDEESGDEGKHVHVFPFLKRLIATFEPFSGLSRTTPFRVGVQMIDSQLSEFWRIRQGPILNTDRRNCASGATTPNAKSP